MNLHSFELGQFRPGQIWAFAEKMFSHLGHTVLLQESKSSHELFQLINSCYVTLFYFSGNE